ncbi:hypothetical protein [Paenibacillus prosopidis]|uniref:hypothetical protein n=1 Tax=Paenibacillus prosopidis TaxID=630520 RepID=UPI0011C04BB5|nr:hypothetical protein [Paenibacillus prosopidis]
MDFEQRKAWNEKHKLLTEILLKPDEHSRAVQLFLSQHALLHSSEVGDVGKPTLEGELLNNLDDITFRKYYGISSTQRKDPYGKILGCRYYGLQLLIAAVP